MNDYRSKKVSNLMRTFTKRHYHASIVMILLSVFQQVILSSARARVRVCLPLRVSVCVFSPIPSPN